MKLLNTFLLLILIGLGITAKAQYNIVGKWQLVEDADSGLFIFDAEGYMSMVENGEISGGKSYEFNDEYDACTQYFLTPTKDASVFKFDMYVRILDEDSTVAFMGPGLVKFVNSNTLLMAMDFDHEEEGDIPAAKKEALRPKDFNNKENVATLKRIK